MKRDIFLIFSTSSHLRFIFDQNCYSPHWALVSTGISANQNLAISIYVIRMLLQHNWCCWLEGLSQRGRYSTFLSFTYFYHFSFLYIIELLCIYKSFSSICSGVTAQEMASQPSRRPRNVSPASSSKPQPLRAVHPFSLIRNPSPTRGNIIRKSPSSSPVHNLDKTRCSPEHSRRSPTSPSLAKGNLTFSFALFVILYILWLYWTSKYPEFYKLWLIMLPILDRARIVGNKISFSQLRTGSFEPTQSGRVSLTIIHGCCCSQRCHNFPKPYLTVSYFSLQSKGQSHLEQ